MLTIMPMFIGTSELLLIAALVLLLFGGKKLPEMMRGMGQGVKAFKDGMSDGTGEKPTEPQQAEAAIKEAGDKIPAEQKSQIEAIVAKLKAAKDAKDIAGIDAATQELQNMMGQAAQNMYGQPGAGAQGNAGAGQQNNGNNGEPQGVDFEEVK